ncbi:tetraspanin-6-like isoform X1 [Phalaenopsis equestris]|uniref:tetraspanin-6-like isoform X1 n=1 Tax=Phalaenopsis equestris TaxID=78828 RepID=UPI0009E2E305|nr:tetraspanin-6-like isoform X1 [Phalaenopsis equestris]
MYRFSNSAIGYLNFLTLLSSIPIIAGALWLARSSSTCDSALETPLLAVGFIILLVSLAGFIGACFNVVWALWLYLLAMFLLIVSLLCITVFGFAVTGGGGGGAEIPGRMYREYHLGDYSAWLRGRIAEERYWRAAAACVVGSRTCADIVRWTPLDYMQRDLTPIQLISLFFPTITLCSQGAASLQPHANTRPRRSSWQSRRRTATAGTTPPISFATAAIHARPEFWNKSGEIGISSPFSTSSSSSSSSPSTRSAAALSATLAGRSPIIPTAIIGCLRSDLSGITTGGGGGEIEGISFGR